MKIVLLAAAAVLAAFYGGFIYGKSKVKVQIIEKQVEVIKYAAQKRAKIQAEPNASRDELLKLMRAGAL